MDRGRGSTDGFVDPLEDRVGIVEDGLVAEAQDLEASLLEVDVPILVPGLLRTGVMDLPIQLDDQPSLTAAEVNDEDTDRVLAAELQTLKSVLAQEPPYRLLGWGLRLPKLLGAGSDKWAGSH